MNRHEFLFGCHTADSGVPSVARTQDERESRDRLFRAAMAAGMDSATIDPERLYELFNHEKGSVPDSDRLKI
ncbi:hypothetical protein [Breoghania sp.]|uniref:hypothetical protein n=1 Tax=Breoghania sp. TaxID=2065378 RepID=UPI002623BF44|nr:hypothetical protein [Breoghania sp.]MDJ0932881.1 hypothetical protein [Breoghania sp.]